MMSCSSITPRICSFSLTMSGVPPFSEMRRTVSSIPAGHFVAGRRRDAEDRFRCALADAASVEHIDARTFGLGGELHHLHADLRGSTFMPIRRPARRRVCLRASGRDRRKHAQAGELFDTVSLCRVECRRFAVADGDRARLVQQQRVDVTGGLDGCPDLVMTLARRGAVHARADGDNVRRWWSNQADEPAR